MKIGMTGLGRMGMNMTRRLLRAGVEVVANSRSRAKVDAAASEGAEPCYALEEMPGMLPSPRVVWIMVPAGGPVDETIGRLLPHLEEGDIVIDGGNSWYKDSIRRHDMLKERGVRFLDAGTSGGVWGLKEGYCLMVGGEKEAFEHCEPVFAALAPEGGYLHCGPAGAGHFVKMVHNGIEYGMLQAYAEGFEILEKSPHYELDLAAVSRLWNRGSVVRSWLLELAERVFEEDPHLDGLKGYVADSGEGRWTVQEAMDEDVPAPVITLSLLMRFRSRQEDSFAAKVIAGLRNQFGGHAVKKN